MVVWTDMSQWKKQISQNVKFPAYNFFKFYFNYWVTYFFSRHIAT